ncbi:MAG: hypothetical protein M5R40_08155 [Anaerolineae bacterium]|nr:hypothetical protein [Anaerolineae bacterium]
MVRRWVVPIFLFVLATIPVAAGGAQGEDDACPVFTAMALEQVGEACDGLGRNETCYGNPQLEMTFREVSANLRFTQPADRVPVRVVDTLHTSRDGPGARGLGRQCDAHPGRPARHAARRGRDLPVVR